ncbi:MAG TPA: ketoacyl-ACP synthase III [Nitrospiraceae bacterium]|nr:ketoacyl-ACP synthase III [Nitrospiraceae bacterium]
MKLRHIAYAIPDRRVESAVISQWTGLDLQFLTEKIGIESRRFLGREEQPIDLAHAACRNLLSECHELDLARIGLLVVVTQNPDYKIPHSSALLHHALGLGKTVACFDLNLGCSGFVYGLSVVKSLMLAESLTDALLVTCDPYSRIIGRMDRDTVALFGDAATASWLSAEAGGDLGKPDFGTNGAGAENLMVKLGGSAYPVMSIDGEAKEAGSAEGYRLHMNGRGILEFMMQEVPRTVSRCLKKNGLELSDIDSFVFHQASQYLLQQLRKKLGLAPEKVPCNIRDVGNTVSSSIPLLLAQLQTKEGLAGKRILVCGFGVGLSWATNVIQY